MQPEYKDAVTVIGTSRFVGPISQGQRIDFSWTKFSILRPDQPSRRPVKRLLATLENLQALHVAAIFVYFIPETAYAPGSWNFTFFYANSTASTAVELLGIIVSLLHRITSNMMNMIFVRKLFIFELELFLSIFFSSFILCSNSRYICRQQKSD